MVKPIYFKVTLRIQKCNNNKLLQTVYKYNSTEWNSSCSSPLNGDLFFMLNLLCEHFINY